MDCGIQIITDQFDNGVDVDPPGHVADEIHQCRHADERQADGYAERKMGNEVAFCFGSHAPQHDQRITEGPKKCSERQLVAAIRCEIAKQPRSHLAGRQRKRSDRDRKNSARHAYG